ncbi:MAG: cysteine desulfurase/selenocysteine lyase [Saprospiraceae bacterium]|jgi:cysteine desulfurase/selenocysteine lyase
MSYFQKLREDFPLLQQQVNGKDLVYFDNGATAQKPQIVLDEITHYYTKLNANIHRGVHTLSQEATSKYEEARKKIQAYLNAEFEEEIIFTKGTTDGINLVANGFSRGVLKEGDEVIISAMEHHSNIVPWQMACEYSGAVLKVIPISDEGELLIEDYKNLLNDKTKLVAITHVSNTLGTINPVKEIIALAHQNGTPVLIDGAQSVPHMRVDVRNLDADFYTFSAHKMYGPTGVGILYGKKEWLNKLPPYQGGGDMIKAVTFEKTTYNDLPHKFEAGTPNIAGGIVMGGLIDYLEKIDWEQVAKHEEELLSYATSQIKEIQGIRIVGQAKHKAGVLSFVHESIHHYDLGTLLDQMGIAIRTGHHCTEPLMERMGVTGTARASFAFYNTREEVDYFIKSLKRALTMLG